MRVRAGIVGRCLLAGLRAGAWLFCGVWCAGHFRLVCVLVMIEGDDVVVWKG